jgi:hypothetical protein
MASMSRLLKLAPRELVELIEGREAALPFGKGRLLLRDVG